MTTHRKQYTRQFKLDVLELARTSGKPHAVLEAELGLYSGQIRSGRRALARDPAQAFPGSGQQAAPDAPLAPLRREHEILRQERDILKKAVARFSRP
jgi:transposase